MSLFDLGRRLWEVTREQGKALWQEIEPELSELQPRWEKVKEGVRARGSFLRQQLQAEARSWLEQELRTHTSQWQHLLARDPELERAYQQLGLPYGTTQEEVKQRWRTLLKETHPDRHMEDPDAQQRATQRSQMLTAAYHQIIKAFDEGRLKPMRTHAPDR